MIKAPNTNDKLSFSPKMNRPTKIEHGTIKYEIGARVMAGELALLKARKYCCPLAATPINDKKYRDEEFKLKL